MNTELLGPIVIITYSVLLIGATFWNMRWGNQNPSATGQRYYTAESSMMQRNWLEDLRKIHQSGRLFVIDRAGMTERDIRRYEKRAPLDVKMHRFRTARPGDNLDTEITGIEFTTASALASYEERIAARGLKPNAAHVIFA